MTEDELRAALATAETNSNHRYRWPMSENEIERVVAKLRAAGLFDKAPDLRKTRAEAEAIWKRRGFAIPAGSPGQGFLDELAVAGFFAPKPLPDGKYEVVYDHQPWAMKRADGVWYWLNGSYVLHQANVRPLARLTETPL